MHRINYKLGHFTYNGHNSSEFGLCIDETPDLNRPERDFISYKVPGRNGAVVEMLNSYSNIDKNYSVWFSKDDYDYNLAATCNAISNWLFSGNNYSRLEDDFEPDIFRQAYFVGPLDINNMLTLYGKTEIKFNCRPERFMKSGENIIDITQGTTINNFTSFIAKPFILVIGTGNIDITIGTHTMHITNLVDFVCIDCDTMSAYRQTIENRNNIISGDFPVIDPGTQEIIVTGSHVTKVEITPRLYVI